jgi:2-methylisocitrate lyase-like PEP mutase family enzyme
MRQTQKLAKLCAQRNAVIVPGAPNAMFARVIEDLGYEAVYVTGAGISNMHLGAPDIGLTSVTEVGNVVSAIADAVELPIIVDADTGFGNSLNVVRTVRLLERSGASGIQLEDQVFPKKCGHFEGKAIIDQLEMVEKIHAAVDARKDEALQIIARTDALSIHGIDAALERAQAYIEAGANLTFVEAPQNRDELTKIPRTLSVPQVANIVYGGKTPDLGRETLAEYGFSLVLYANAALQAALFASREVLESLRDKGSLSAIGERLASFEERQMAVKKPFWDELEARYRIVVGKD